jgi:hypothetical protein
LILLARFRLFPLLALGRTYTAGVTVLESIQKSTEFLTRKGVESPRLQTELLLAHVLGRLRHRLRESCQAGGFRLSFGKV